ncbi:MAG: hypothetical protein U0441_11325 [Polyangiaceae bacterium]
MNSDSDIIGYACANIPSLASDLAPWARDVLGTLVPLVTQASLAREESNYVQFSVAVVTFPAEYNWEAYLFDGVVDCTPADLIKLAGLTSAGETYLIARKVEERMFVVGVGRPLPFFGIRMDHDMAAKMPPQPKYAFIAATVLGPGTILFEGFSVELAFLFEGQLQPRADLIDVGNVQFLHTHLESKNIDMKFKDHPPAPMQSLRPIAGLQVIEKIVRGAWFAGRGGLLAFSVTKRQHQWSGVPSAHWLDESPSLLDLYLDEMLATHEACENTTAVTILGRLNAQRSLEQHILAVIRASTLDGALLFDNSMRLRAFGAKLRPRPLKDFIVPHSGDGPPLDLRTKGTRHLSAASWVAAGRYRMAIVISQDRFVRLFERSADDKLVYMSVRPRLFE